MLWGPLTAVSWCDRTFGAGELTWNEDGSYVEGIPCRLDLISEVYVSDTPPADAPETKTLRDEFAMAVVSGVYVHWRTSLDQFDAFVDFRDIASLAYGVADAMMEARKK